MCLLGRPSAASTTIRLRNATRCAVVPARIQRSNVARCSVVIGKAGARFMGCTVPDPSWKYKTFHDHCTSGCCDHARDMRPQRRLRRAIKGLNAAAARPWRLRGVPTPVSCRMSNPRLKPQTCTSTRLLRSEIFASQKCLAGRVAPPDEQFKSLLSALNERGGKLTRMALAHRLGLPLVRVVGSP